MHDFLIRMQEVPSHVFVISFAKCYLRFQLSLWSKRGNLLYRQY